MLLYKTSEGLDFLSSRNNFVIYLYSVYFQKGSQQIKRHSYNKTAKQLKQSLKDMMQVLGGKRRKIIILESLSC